MSFIRNFTQSITIVYRWIKHFKLSRDSTEKKKSNNLEGLNKLSIDRDRKVSVNQISEIISVLSGNVFKTLKEFWGV